MEKVINITPLVKSIYPEAKFGLMVVKRLGSAVGCSAMGDIVSVEVEQIRSSYPDYQRKAVMETEPLCHYAAYYKRFQKSYPVLGQLESILLKGKSIPPVGAPVEAMFLAEIKNLLLTAGHDLNFIEGALTIDVAMASVSYEGLLGQEQHLVRNDLYLSDEKGVLSSVLNGPDKRTKITATTQSALYFVYGVEGVTEQLIYTHLNNIFSYLSQAIPGAELQAIEVI